MITIPRIEEPKLLMYKIRTTSSFGIPDELVGVINNGCITQCKECTEKNRAKMKKITLAIWIAFCSCQAHTVSNEIVLNATEVDTTLQAVKNLQASISFDSVAIVRAESLVVAYDHEDNTRGIAEQMTEIENRNASMQRARAKIDSIMQLHK